MIFGRITSCSGSSALLVGRAAACHPVRLLIVVLRRHMATRDYQTEFRNRLIESRLTPNAISLTGFGLCIVSAVFVLQGWWIAGGIAYIVWNLLDDLLGRSLPAQIVSIGVALTLGGAAYAALLLRSGLPEARDRLVKLTGEQNRDDRGHCGYCEKRSGENAP